MFVKNVIRGCVLLLLIGSVAWSDVPPGFIEGHVKIFPLREVNLGDDANAAKTVSEQPYAEYPLLVLTRDGKKEIARVTADRDGNYRVALPPGDYILDVQGRGRESGHVRAKPQPFTVVSNQTVRVDMDIDTGIR